MSKYYTVFPTQATVNVVMYRAAKHAGMNLPGALESGGHVVGRIKRVELNLEA